MTTRSCDICGKSERNTNPPTSILIVSCPNETKKNNAQYADICTDCLRKIPLRTHVDFKDLINFANAH